MKSEFGKGLCYCLALFLCHSERDNIMNASFAKTDEEKKCLEIINRASMWFYGAADHIFDLEIPDNLSTRLKRRLKIFKSKVLYWRLPMGNQVESTKEDQEWAIQEAKDLIRLIDKFNGIETQKGQWE